MNKEIINQLNEHISHNDFLEKEDVQYIISRNKELIYEGEAYRVLLFSNEPEIDKLSVFNDFSFSKNLNGIKNYMCSQDLEYYPYAVIFKVKMIGIDIVKSINFFEKELYDKREIAKREEEVVPSEILNSYIFKNGDSNEILTLLLKGEIDV